jgi:branched-chain amino acid transport system permease protein
MSPAPLRSPIACLPLAAAIMLAGGGLAWAAGPPPGRQLAYALQLAVNGLTLGSVYGLLAIGYTLVYRLIGRINLAFGQIAMIGAYVTVLGSMLLTAYVLLPALAAWLGLLLASLIIGAAWGLATDRAVFRPLRTASSQAPLIASIGLAILLEELVRLSQGATERWLPPVGSMGHRLLEAADFAVTISTTQFALLTLVLAIYLALWLLMHHTSFGRAARACADDDGMAALCGVNVDRTIAAVFMLSGGLAGVAGFVLLLRYGGVGFHDGFGFGFKALTAAVVGGIGSLGGAMLGGFLIGLLEAFWAGYLTLAYREIAIFAILALVLILRPGGLLGQPARLRNDLFWRPTAVGQRW